MKIDNLARNIAHDLLAERPKSAPAPTCFACGRGYMQRSPDGDHSTRFCSTRCREAFDNGFPPHDPTYHLKSNPRWYSLPMGPEGFYINCACCGQRFDSKGLRCCSTTCERGLGAKQETERLKAEAGIEFTSKLGAKRRCEAPGCPHDIPRWRNGRAVSKATRFCSPKCSQRARKAHPGLLGDLSAQTERSAHKMGLKMRVQNTDTPSTEEKR